MKEVFTEDDAYVSIRLDRRTLQKLQLSLTSRQVRQAILSAPKLKLKESMIQVVDDWRLHVFPDDLSKERKGRGKEGDGDGDHGGEIFNGIQSLRSQLPKVIVAGIPTVERAVVSRDKDKHMLYVEGTDLLSVMGTDGVVGKQTTSNHVMEVEKILGESPSLSFPPLS